MYFFFPGRIMYHTMTLLSSCDILITGGRSSPQNPNSIVYLLKRDFLSSEKWEWRKPQLLNGTNIPSCHYHYNYIYVRVYMYYVCICMHVCMYACMYACMYIYIYVCMCVHMYVFKSRKRFGTI